jgi:septum site-determining protein MinD
MENIQETLGIPLIGVIPESQAVLASTNLGQPVITLQDNASEAYRDMVKRFIGEDVPMRFTKCDKGFFQKLFGR